VDRHCQPIAHRWLASIALALILTPSIAIAGGQRDRSGKEPTHHASTRNPSDTAVSSPSASPPAVRRRHLAPASKTGVRSILSSQSVDGPLNADRSSVANEPWHAPSITTLPSQGPILQLDGTATECQSCCGDGSCREGDGCHTIGCHTIGCDSIGCDTIGCDTIGCDSIGCDPLSLDGCLGRPLIAPDDGLGIFRWRRLEVFAGTQAFTGPRQVVDVQGQPFDSGSFGLHAGLNYGQPMRSFFCGELSTQLGIRAVGSDFYGDAINDDARTQWFVTAGVFRRVDYGMQGGLVADYLHESSWYRSEVAQLRYEWSWNTGQGHVLGLQGAVGTNDDESIGDVRLADGSTQTIARVVEALDQHRFFYRYQWSDVTRVDLSIGGSADGDTVFGIGGELALNPSWSIRNHFNVALPRDGGDGGLPGDDRRFAAEQWNLAFSLVWYPTPRAASGNYHRPLFEVADNGSFMLRY
jgi:hypothetical protein